MNNEPLIEVISSRLQIIEHMQVAGVPGRREPNTGEINFREIFQHIDQIGYSNWIGCEYYPTNTAAQNYDWIDSL